VLKILYFSAIYVDGPLCLQGLTQNDRSRYSSTRAGGACLPLNPLVKEFWEELSWCRQTRAMLIEVSQGHQT